MWFPRPQAHPTKVSLAIVVATNHVITAAILFYSNMALGAFLPKKEIHLILINSQVQKVRE